MNIPVKIKRTLKECRACEEFAQSCNATSDCKECTMQSGVWVSTVKNVFETLAIVVLGNGEVIKIPISRIHNANVKILEVEE